MDRCYNFSPIPDARRSTGPHLNDVLDRAKDSNTGAKMGVSRWTDSSKATLTLMRTSVRSELSGCFSGTPRPSIDGDGKVFGSI